MINYINKDITTVTRGIIAHGVNCQGVMGSGVAKALRDKWPVVYEVYSQRRTEKSMLGMCDIIKVDDELFVANCYTQVFYGRDGRQYADTNAIKGSIFGALSWADYYNLPLYMPKIGAGLGGLSWEKEVEPIIEYADSKWSRVDTYVCEWNG